MNRRYPLIFGLLLAATVCVDAVVAALLDRHGRQDFLLTMFEALAFSQLAVVCLWAMLGAVRSWWVLCLPFAAAAALAWLTLYLYILEDFRDGLAIFGSFVVGLLAALWILKRTPWWHRAVATENARLQFTVSQLLSATTILAVSIAVILQTDFFWSIWELVGFLILGGILTAIGTFVVWQRPAGLFTRLGLAAAVGGLLAAATMSFQWVRPVDSTQRLAGINALHKAAYFLIQAGVIFFWLEVGQIIARRESSDAAET